MTRFRSGPPHGLAHLLPLCALAFAGCGTSQPTTYPVEGTVTLRKGMLLPGGTIELESQELSNRKFNARGKIGPDGKFRLTTFHDGDGAVAGEHRCVILPEVDLKKAWDESYKPKQVIPTKYTKYETSPLKLTVKTEKNVLQIVLE